MMKTWSDYQREAERAYRIAAFAGCTLMGAQGFALGRMVVTTGSERFLFQVVLIVTSLGLLSFALIARTFQRDLELPDPRNTIHLSHYRSQRS